MSKAEKADTTSRRGFLRLGSMLSGGAATGLLVPWAGGKVFALAEPAKAANLAVTTSSFAMSSAAQIFRHEVLGLEEVMRAYTLGKLKPESGYTEDGHGPGYMRYLAKQRNGVRNAAYPVWERGADTWSDLADLAEIAYFAAPKELTWDYSTLARPPMSGKYTGNLVRHTTSTRSHREATTVADRDWYYAANAALIEGVLKLTGRTPYDPSLAHDRWRIEYAPNAMSYPT